MMKPANTWFSLRSFSSCFLASCNSLVNFFSFSVISVFSFLRSSICFFKQNHKLNDIRKYTTKFDHNKMIRHEKKTESSELQPSKSPTKVYLKALNNLFRRDALHCLKKVQNYILLIKLIIHRKFQPRACHCSIIFSKRLQKQRAT